ncbi:hypothetical protein QR680_013581 [Steinernema hermaphroditum]|uniref:Ribosomal RNA-processing protein 8 n=1 Tax=Steinernema hermaphroditum TaxID=289476 RepID=A0AA39I7L6_9BILA|nr:hypothetical protein QR680_013581 [Steinernema hermaphroditum]
MVRKLKKAESEVQGRTEKRKLRNLARLKKRKELQSAAKKVEKVAQSLAFEDDKPKKKKNKGKKKKFLKLEAKASELGVPVENLIENEEGHMVKRLEGGRFRFINEQLYTMTGEEAQKMFEEDPAAFDHYHAGYRDQAKKWPLNPVNVIIQQLRSKTGLVIADMGCGDAKIAECLGTRNTVHSFDLVAKKPCVVACEMSNVPLENNSCDVVVFCLSLMGTNINEYLREAHRLLKMGGELRIAEVTSRFENVRAFMRGVCRMGFEFKTSKTMQDYFVVFQFKKAGKIEHKRPNGLTLKPCLYKKR